MSEPKKMEVPTPEFKAKVGLGIRRSDTNGAALIFWHLNAALPAFASARHTGESRCPEWCSDTGAWLALGQRVAFRCFGNYLL
jgi:hypothetical protein